MRVTIDAAGRVVVPKPAREELALVAGAELELLVRDGRIEMEPAARPVRIDERDDGPVIVPEDEAPSLTADRIREALERTRR